MTSVRIGLLAPTSDGTGRRPTGTLEWRPTMRRDVAGDVVLPAPFTVGLADTPPVIDVAPTEPGWAWAVVERVQGGSAHKRLLLVPDVGTVVDYADLVEVDPATLDPVALGNAWWTQVTDYAQPLGDYATNTALSTGLAGKVNSSTYTAGVAGKQDTATLGATVAADSTVKAALAPFGTPGERTLTAAADVSGAPAPTALAFKRWFTKRHFFDLKLPLGDLDLSMSPLMTGGTVFNSVAVENGGMTYGYNASGQLTVAHTTDATQTQGVAALWPIHAFATYELNVASWTATVYGNIGWEFRNSDGTNRIIVTYSKTGGRVQFEQLVNGTSQGLVSQTIATPGAFTLRVQFQGRSLNVWITVGGTTTYCGRLALVGLDFRNPTVRTGWTAGIAARGHTDFTFAVSGASVYLAGHGHADPRIVTYEDGTPIQVGETVWVAMTTRGVAIQDAYQGVYAYNTATGQLTATGAIFCDRGDGIARNENAGQLMYDRVAGKWRYFTIGHSDFPNARLVYLSTGDTDLRYGINTATVAQVNITGDDGVTLFYEDFHAIYDSSLSKWVATASKNASISARLEATSPAGPWAETAAAGTNETGNQIVKIGASRYILAGTATAAYVVRDYTTLASLGNLTLDYDTGATRVWPVVFPVRTGSGTRWHMLSFDRTDPTPDHGYGRVARYRA